MKILKHNRRKIINVIFVLIILVFRIAISIYAFNFKYKSFKNLNIEVKIIDIFKIEEEKVIYRVKYNNDNFLLSLKDVENIYEYGNKLKLNASLYDIEYKNNPFEFNYKRYLNSNGYVSVLYANKVKSIEERKGILNIVYYLRKNINKKIDNNLESKKANLLKSILYGDDLFLDEDIKNIFTNVGLGHILCVSGTHIALLIESFESITKSKKSKILRTLLLIIFYIFSLFNISLLRAIIMKMLSMFKRYTNIYKRYFISIIIIIVINPYYIFNVGVLFSFLSVLSLLLFNSRINSFFKFKFKNKFIYPFFNSLSTTVSSQILIFPVEVAVFGKISLICVFSNLILSWIINIIIQLGFASLFLIYIPYVSNMLFNCINISIELILFLTRIMNNYNYLDIHLPRFSTTMYILYYLFFILVLIEDKVWIYFWNKRKIIKRIVRVMKKICIIWIIFKLIYIQYLESYVLYFNVGQGNMALIHHYTKNVVIDMGSTEKNVAYNVLKNYLKAKNISSVDILCVTHMHTDHINGIEQLLLDKDIKVKRIGFSFPCITVEEYYKLLDTINESRVSKIYFSQNNIIKIGKIKIQILTPPGNTFFIDEDMLNANSTVYLVEKSKKKYLFMGDATKKTEKYILEKYEEKLEKINVIQLSHHGSSTSSYEPFISKLNNQCICVISSKKKVYGHPSELVLKLLNKYNLKYKITEKEGAVLF